MSAASVQRVAARVAPGPRLLLLGTGVVGTAFVERAGALAARGMPVPAFAALANSRGTFACDDRPAQALARAIAAVPVSDPAAPARWVDETLRPGDLVVDATASDEVAGCHAAWLRQGIHVVSANKLGAGAGLARAQAISQAVRSGSGRYGDSATVGAGLPVLRSIRELVAGGDRIDSIQGVLSGSLAWLFDRFDGSVPFSGLVRRARHQGFTEPDPRIDLSGEDVRRKLLILARAAGMPLTSAQVEVSPLCTPTLQAAPTEAMDGLLAELDQELQVRLALARRNYQVLRHIGRWQGEHAQVRLEAVEIGHPLLAGGGTDNVVAIGSCRYRAQPLVISGPGAGARVTAAALLDDVLRIQR